MKLVLYPVVVVGGWAFLSAVFGPLIGRFIRGPVPNTDLLP
jgi:hypothetical protein